jgi:hypothetical protein
MKLKDAIRLVNKEKNNSTEADVDDFARAVNADVYIGWSDKWNERVKGYWLVRWLCTDTWVGRRVYFFDGEPVATSYQSARKNDEYIEFVNNEAAEKIRSFIFELQGEEEKPTYNILDANEEIEEFYNFDLTDYFLEDYGFVDGQAVKIIKQRYFENDDDKRWVCYHAKVKFEGGEERVVKAEEIHFPLRVTKETN